MFMLIITFILFLPIPTTSYHYQVKRQEDGLAIFIRNSFYNFGEFLASGAYDLRLPSIDPIQIKRRFTFETTTNSTYLSGSIRQITVNGLSNMSTTDINITVPNLKLNITFTIHKLMITGYYSAEGIIQHVLPLHGNGDFVVEAENVVATVNVDMKMNTEDNNLDIDKFNVSFKAEYLIQAFGNVLGGGHIGSLMNYFGRKLGENVFKVLHPFFNQSFGKAIQRKLIQVLRKIKISPETGSAMNMKRSMQGSGEKFSDYFDQVVVNIKKVLNERNLDLLPLPDFDSKIFQNGSLSGLGSLQRYSDAFISSNINNTVMIDVSFLLRNVSCAYNWIIWFLPENKGRIELKADIIIINLKIQVDLMNKEMTIDVVNLKIMDMSGVLLNLKGLGTFNSLILSMVNKMALVFTKTFTNLLEKALKSVLEFSLNYFLRINQLDK